jgi:hypothetical protein
VDQFEGENDFEIGSGVKNEDLKEAPKEMIETISYLRDNVPKNATIIELGGSKHQRRSGFPYSFFDNYIPLDISLSSMIGYSEIYDKQSIACDAQDLPFKDNVIENTVIKNLVENQNFAEAESYLKDNILDKPNKFFTIDKQCHGSNDH